MTKPPFGCMFLVAGLLAAAAPAMAQESAVSTEDQVEALMALARGDVPTSESDIGTDLYSVVMQRADGSSVRDVVYVDYFHDGVQAALVLTDDCVEDLCRWDFIAHTGEGYETVGSSIGKNVRFQPTEGDGRVINSDGVIWAWTGTGWIRPWGSLVDEVTPRAGGEREMKVVTGFNKYWDPASMDLTVYEMDLLDNGWNQRFVDIGGMCCLAGPNGFPWMVIDQNNQILAEGLSIDQPHLFRKDGGGTTIVSQRVNGYLAQDITFEDGEK